MTNDKQIAGTIQFMILQPQHQHEQTPAVTVTQPSPPKPKRQQPPALAPTILTHLLQTSSQLIGDKGIKQIKSMLDYSERKVLLSFSQNANPYLQHLSAKHESENGNFMKQIIQLQTELVIDRIEWGDVRVNERNNIKELKTDIRNKLSQMKSNIVSLSSIDRRASMELENIMEFRKKGYWNNQSEKGQHVKEFLGRMKKIQSQQKRRYDREMSVREELMLKEEEKQKAMRQEMKKQMFAKQLQKQTNWRKERQKYQQVQNKKREEISNLLQKIKPAKPVYIQKEQQFIKKVIEPLQEYRQKKLQQIRQSHHPFDQEEIDQHLQRYQEYKQSLLEEHRKKEEESSQMHTKLEQELKELYHHRHHKDIEPRFYNSVKLEKVENRKKIVDYGKSVLENYKPLVDPKKRLMVKEQILELELQENKKKRKVILEDGSVVIEDKPEYDAKKIGVQYLQKLRESNEGKPRKKQDRSNSMMQLSESTRVKRIDYLRESKPNIILKHTLGTWKKVVDDNSYNPRQKYASIMQQVNVMQQKAKQKQSEMRSYKKGEKAMELKEQMDKFYMESVAAKLVVLKDVILKE